MKNKKNLSQFAKDVQEYVRGDFEKETIIAKMKDEDYTLVNNWLQEEKQQIILRRADIIHVLNRYTQRRVSAIKLSNWGRFLFWRHWVPIPKGKFMPLKIDYVPENDDLMREIIMRLEQIGDRIEGTFTTDEAIEYLRKLGA